MLTVSHELKPDTADKLKIKLSSPGDGQQLHRVRVVVYHDTSPKPVRAGEVLVAVPRVGIQGYLQASSSAACLRDNRAKLRRLLKTGAPAPAKLVNLLAEES